MDNSSLGTSFDFNTQAGVMAVLAAVRQSALTPAQKNELRDLVFLYANGGGDASVRISLEQKLTTYQIKPVAAVSKSASETTPVVLPFGSSRPQPSFTAPVAAVPVMTTPGTPSSVSAVDATPVVPVPVSEVTVPVVPLSVATPVVEVKSIPLPVPAPAPVVTPAAPVVATPNAPVTPSVATSASVTPTSTPVQGTPAAFSDINTNYLDRIREIKTAVNSKVGNPVNLVDIDNAVGREYMNALLDAMKRLSGGAGQIDPAMERLEVAFEAVEVAIAAHENAKNAPQIVAEPATPIVENVPEIKESVAAPVTPAAEPVITSVPVPELVTKPDFDEIPLVREDDMRWDAITPVTPPPQAEHAEPALVTPVQNPVFSSIVNDRAAVTAASVAPIVEEQAPLTPQDLPVTIAANTNDPLLAKEIDDGLEQLLSDWILFKKSGLFGTGPKGREHPLFKKLAPLQIPLLLAGRFEGSTQEIKQSITDYMNGWRYEQGIIYEQGETFEHYLRRVIKQILDLQKKRRPS